MVSMFTIPFFWDSTHYEVYSILSHLLGGLPLPTCSLCVSNYTTLISAFLREGALPRAMWWWLGWSLLFPSFGSVKFIDLGVWSLFFWNHLNIFISSLCSQHFWTARSKERLASFKFQWLSYHPWVVLRLHSLSKLAFSGKVLQSST